MRKGSKASFVFGFAALVATAPAGVAFAQPDDPSLSGPPEPYGPPPIPSASEGEAVASPGGGYCYVGPHPNDTRVAAGGPWDGTVGPHTHFYPPFDLRLYTLRDGCYYFVGDPRDFGYQGEAYNYYGAHPVLESYGGGWCFMIGAHTHWWRPWSSNFVVVGPWYYWHGPYDPFFWSYWPYYSYYYRSYYPHYYGGGRFYRSREFHVAPPIRQVPNNYGRNGYAGNGWRGGPAPGNGGRPATVAPSGGWRGSSPPAAPGAGGAGNAWTTPARGGWGKPAPVTPNGNWGGNNATRNRAPVGPSGGFRGGSVTPAPHGNSGGNQGGGNGKHGGWRH